jgi:hypothetical protein
MSADVSHYKTLLEQFHVLIRVIFDLVLTLNQLEAQLADMEVVNPQYADGPEVFHHQAPKQDNSLPNGNNYIKEDEASYLAGRRRIFGLGLPILSLTVLFILIIVGLAVAAGIEGSKPSSPFFCEHRMQQHFNIQQQLHIKQRRPRRHARHRRRLRIQFPYQRHQLRLPDRRHLQVLLPAGLCRQQLARRDLAEFRSLY